MVEVLWPVSSPHVWRLSMGSHLLMFEWVCGCDSVSSTSLSSLAGMAVGPLRAYPVSKLH